MNVLDSEIPSICESIPVRVASWKSVKTYSSRAPFNFLLYTANASFPLMAKSPKTPVRLPASRFTVRDCMLAGSWSLK